MNGQRTCGGGLGLGQELLRLHLLTPPRLLLLPARVRRRAPLLLLRLVRVGVGRVGRVGVGVGRVGVRVGVGVGVRVVGL